MTTHATAELPLPLYGCANEDCASAHSWPAMSLQWAGFKTPNDGALRLVLSALLGADQALSSVGR